MDLLWISVIVGSVLGLLMSVLFAMYSKKSPVSYIRTLFGISSYNLIFDGIIFIVIVSFLLLAVMSGVIQDLAYPIGKPVNFTIETLLMAFLPASVFLIMTPLRGYSIDGKSFEEFTILSLKFGLLHILLQFSGFYSNLFPYNG
jgi:hypothetical protein